MSGLLQLKREVKEELVKQTPKLILNILDPALKEDGIRRQRKVAESAKVQESQQDRKSKDDPLKNLKKYNNFESLIKYIEDPSGGLKIVILNFND